MFIVEGDSYVLLKTKGKYLEDGIELKDKKKVNFGGTEGHQVLTSLEL